MELPHNDVKFKITWQDTDGKYRVWRGNARHFETSVDGFDSFPTFSFSVLGTSTVSLSDDPDKCVVTFAKKNPSFTDIRTFMNDNNIPGHAKVKTTKKEVIFSWRD